MDINQQDRAKLNAKSCPDCGSPLEKYFFDEFRPWCRKCDVWFEVDSSGWVIRNLEAGHHYIREWEKMIKENAALLGGGV